MSQTNEQELFYDVVRAFETEIANMGAHMHLDSEARAVYVKEIRAMSAELMREAEAGIITWSEAAKKAQEARNVVMDIIRNRSTPVGLSIAQQFKSEGRTLNELIARKTEQIHGRSARFEYLSKPERNRIFVEIVESSGRSNPRVTAAMQRIGHAGRGLIVLSVALSTYNVAVAENKSLAVARKATITGAGIGGGIAGGALAGLACGPGAPVCVTVGAFIGGALAAFGVSCLCDPRGVRCYSKRKPSRSARHGLLSKETSPGASWFSMAGHLVIALMAAYWNPHCNTMPVI
jgi:hypothetical protein